MRRIVKHTLFESSRAGESHDAGYEDGSHGVDPRYPDDMDYMSGWEMGEEDIQYDKKVSQKSIMEANPVYPKHMFPDRDPTARQMSTPEQRDPGAGGTADAARLLNGILDDWMNEPDMNSTVADKYFERVEDAFIILKQLGVE